MRGYAGKWAEVDLTTGSVREVSFDETTLRRFIGGRGLAAKILWDRLGERWEEVDPLGPENLLLLLTGPLTGYFPGGRICVSGKSPQSNGIVGSTVAGEFGIDLKCAGYDGLIITGEAPAPVYLLVTDGQVEVRDAKHLWGLDSKATLRELNREVREELSRREPGYGLWKEPSSLYIGPAGENRVRAAGVLSKWTHAAGYGGYGAVMGAKKLKAVVAKGTGPLPEPADIKWTMRLMAEASRKCIGNEPLRFWGTGYAGYEVGSSLSSEPVRNWQEEWHDEDSFSSISFEQRVWIKRFWGDFNCPTTCLKIACIREGPYAGAVTDNPDYELQAYDGTNLGIFTPEANVYMVAELEDLGYCGIQGGNLLAFAAELYQRGILTKEELDGIELKWGEPEGFVKLARMIAERRGIGDILAEGTYRAALKLGELKGQDLVRYAVTAKGIGIGAHGVRSGLDYVINISYACSVQGGDHTSPAQIPTTAPLGELSVILHDSGVYCWFNEMSTEIDMVFQFLEAVTGWKITPEEWFEENALRILHIQRAALLLGGPDLKWRPVKDDDNPPRFYEPLPSGPKAGHSIDPREVEENRRKYYELVGWDERGIPKSEVLRRLELEDVDRVLRRYFP
jgi:aldehyde:ferredoxin oxidoreductase